MILDAETMNGPFLRRRRARRAEKREQAKQIEEETSQMLKDHMESYGTRGPTVGAGVASGTYVDESTIHAQQLDADAQAAADQQRTIRLVGTAVVVGVIILAFRKKSKD